MTDDRSIKFVRDNYEADDFGWEDPDYAHDDCIPVGNLLDYVCDLTPTQIVESYPDTDALLDALNATVGPGHSAIAEHHDSNAHAGSIRFCPDPLCSTYPTN